MKSRRRRGLHASLHTCCLLAITLIPIAESEPVVSGPTDIGSTPTLIQSVTFDPSGNYIFADKAPKRFENLRWIALETSEIDPRKLTRRSIAPRGSLWAGKEFKMARLALDGDKLSFTTRTIAGIGYQFSGLFLRRGVYSEVFDSESTEVVLRGRLTKTRRGRKVAESEVGFHWYRGD
jgi:hypothetical protein